MPSNNGLNTSIVRAEKHYSSLFTLPSLLIILIINFVLTFVGGTFIVVWPSLSLNQIILGLQFSLFFFFISVFSDIITKTIITIGDPVYNLKRCGGLSMFSNFLWFVYLFIGSLLIIILNSWAFWVYSFSIGFVSVLILRFIVFSSTSFLNKWRVVIATFLQPFLCLLPIYYITLHMQPSMIFSSILYLAITTPIALFAGFILIYFVDAVGMKTVKVPSTSVLKAFLANWMENLNTPIEELFESFGKKKSIDYSILAFRNNKKFNSMLIVSSFHPGPFRNVGSSCLPFMIKDSLQKKFSCNVAVPHGLYGHEFDLTSQSQNHKLLNRIVNSVPFENFTTLASPFVRKDKGIASASCQIFGDCAFITLTLAPKTTEDLPRDVGDKISNEAAELGLKHVIVVNAHNSIDSSFDIKASTRLLEEAAIEALDETFRLERLECKVGSSTIFPDGYGLEQGMGPGGITAFIVEVGKKKSVYITIDGNNMVTGLREEILKSLKVLDVNLGEVLTTDTHIVNAIVMNRRGYHPLGEAITWGRLTSDVKNAVIAAIDSIEPCQIAWCKGEVSNVKVVGEKQIEGLSLLADKALQRAKRTMIPLFTVVGCVLVFLLNLI